MTKDKWEFFSQMYMAWGILGLTLSGTEGQYEIKLHVDQCGKRSDKVKRLRLFSSTVCCSLSGNKLCWCVN